MKKWVSVVCLALVLMLLSSGMACASATGSGLPWEKTIKMISDSLSGPVAHAVCILAMFVGGAGVALGGDMTGCVRSVSVLALVAGLIGMGVELLAAFGLSAAMVL